MKGPRGRLKHFIRRHWECPICHRREWTSGKVVNRRCDCLAKSDPPRQTWMTLIEDVSPSPQQVRAGSVSDPRIEGEKVVPDPVPSPPSPLPQGERGES